MDRDQVILICMDVVEQRYTLREAIAFIQKQDSKWTAHQIKSIYEKLKFNP